MHNSYIRPGGLWTGSATITPAEMGQLDVAQFKAGNFDDGGTWAPAAVITVGGSGMTVSGPFAATDVTGLIDVQGGGQIKIEGGALFTVLAGANASINAGANLIVAGTIEYQAGSVLQLDGTVNPTYGTPRSVPKRGLRLVSSTYSLGSISPPASNPASPDAFSFSYLNYPGVLTVSQTANNPSCNAFFELPSYREMTGATLTSVQVISQGVSATPTIYPAFDVVRILAQAGTPTTASLHSTGAVADHHSTGVAWNNYDSTTYTPDQNNIIDPTTYDYYVKMTNFPYAAAGSQVTILGFIATYSVPNLQK